MTAANHKIEAETEHLSGCAIYNGAKVASIIVVNRLTGTRIAPTPARFHPSNEKRRIELARKLEVPEEWRRETPQLLDDLATQYEERQWEAGASSRDPEAEHDEIMLADLFIARYSDRFLYTDEWRHWSTWDGHVWRPDRTLHVFDLARGICREIADRTDGTVRAGRIATAATIAAVEKIAKARRAVAAPVESWDADPYLLNTPGGVVDLRTGDLREARPSDRCRQMTAVAPDFDADCPKWRVHLRWAMTEEEDRIAYLQRHMGYCLTGNISEHSLDFWHGGGGNGKSVVMNAFAGILGDYAVTSPVTTFTASKVERHTTELAMLRGARLVTARETEEGRNWNEQRLKELTGGEPITARFMRQDNTTFMPTLKLVVVGNHRPHFRNVDEAIRRRLHLVAFNATVTAEAKNIRLGDELREEWPAILAWLVEGCLEWQRVGLQPPQSVQDDTTEYLSNEDPFSDWLAEQCEAKGATFTASAVLFEAWRAWAARHGEEPGSWRDLRERFVQRGFHVSRTEAARGIAGLRLRLPEPTEQHEDRRAGS